jgi:DNA-binding IclR family transcriptional regulator
MDRALQTIRATYFAGGIYRPASLARAAGTTPAAARRAILGLVAEKSLYKVARGQYRVTPYGPLARGL